MKKWLCILLCLVMILGMCACGGEETAEETTAQTEEPRKSYQGLVLKAAPDITVTLMSEFEEGVVIEPSDTYTYGDEIYYCYSNLMGALRYTAKGKGYYTVTKNLVMTQEKNEVETLIDVTPGKLSDGWEPKSYSSYTDEILNGSFGSDLSLWPEYAALMTSPWYTQPHGDQQITTQQQMEDYLQSLDGADDQMYLFSAGASAKYNYNIPMAIFTTTDLSSAKTVDDAAALMGQDKPTVVYRAQMHGNEPAGGEAALVMIGWLDSALGAELLDKINICVIPRQNPDGARNYVRTVLGDKDPNRDSLQMRTQEIVEFTRICLLLDPELIIDGHEYNANVEDATLGTGDLLVGVGFTNENSDAFRALGMALADQSIQAVTANGLDYRYYSNYVNSVNANISRTYWSMQGTQFVLLETRGIGCGLDAYNRRIMTHVVATEALLRYVAANADAVQTNVTNERQRIMDQGNVYSTDQILVLDYSAVEDLSLRHTGRKHDQLTGTTKDATYTPKVYSSIVRYRMAPTAYVIPAGESYTETVLKLMNRHNIAYTFIPAGSRVRLQQYLGNGDEATLTDEMTVTFPAGAYVFCRNQVQGNILSMLMEPDVTELAEQNGTLIQQGLITPSDGKIPIYRYIHDLTADGMISYS